MFFEEVYFILWRYKIGSSTQNYSINQNKQTIKKFIKKTGVLLSIK